MSQFDLIVSGRTVCFALLMLLLLNPGSPGLAQAGYSAPPFVSERPPLRRVIGPREFCAEGFSIHLQGGEVVSWNDESVAPMSYDVYSDRQYITISGLAFPLPPDVVERHELRLRYSRVTQRIVVRLPGDRSSFGIHYLFHGDSRQSDPVHLFVNSPDRRLEPSIIQHVQPGSLDQRDCSPSWIEQSGTVGERQEHP